MLSKDNTTFFSPYFKSKENFRGIRIVDKLYTTLLSSYLDY